MDIKAISGVERLHQTAVGPSSPKTTGLSFSEVLGDAMGRLNQLQAEADSAALRLALGDQVELHDVMIASEKAALAFHLALQVRNKLVEAYQEIMRIQV